MAQVMIDNLDPEILQQLQVLAQQHDRPLAEEAKVILTQAVMAATKPKLTEAEIMERGIILMEKQMRDRAQKMGQPVEPERPTTEDDRVQIRAVIERFRELRQKTSLDGMTIRELREEGRRY